MEPECEPPKSIVIIGDMGSGKSTYINAVQGSEQATGKGTKAVTNDFKVINENGLEMIDCPGFLDTKRDEDEWGEDYADALKKLTTPLCAIGFLCNSNNYRVKVTDCEWKIYM